ncbi:MAG TPA: signal peptidase I [Longimicrobium sp.]|nr:signal peptidase I [Longimicrobium sp.]
MTAADPPAPAAAETAPPVGRRRPWVAALLTFLAPPVGHVYAGRPLRGLAAWALALSFGAAMLYACMTADSRGGRLLALALLPLAWVALPADAAWTAHRADPRAPRRGYQRKAVYAVLVIAVALFGNLLFFPALLSRWRAFSLPSVNMEPALLPGDYVMTARTAFDPRRGMVVTRMTDEGYESVARVAGVAGDTLAMRSGKLWVNGRAESGVRVPATADGEWEKGFGWQRAHLAGDTAGYAPTSADWGPLVVPPGHVFVLGDNRPMSLDSRYLGFIPLDRLTGRVVWIYLSRDRATGTMRWSRMGHEVR